MAAHISHEERVRAFIASVPERRLARVEAKHRVLSDEDEAEVLQQERPESPQVLDQVLATGGPIHRTPLRSLPEFDEGA